MSIFNHQEQGFTLIELLIVLVISGLTLSLVGGLTFSQIDSSRQLREREQVLSLLEQVRFEARHSQNSYQVELSGDTVRISRLTGYLSTAVPADDTPQLVKSLATQYLRFPPQVLQVNSNGFWSVDRVRWTSVNAPDRPRYSELSTLGQQYAL